MLLGMFVRLYRFEDLLGLYSNNDIDDFDIFQMIVVVSEVLV